MHKYYAGIGSRQTPPNILAAMKTLASHLARSGYILRSGAADGADSAFESGCDAVGGPKQIYIPWSGFNKRNHGHGVVSLDRVGKPARDWAESIAKEHHPSFGRLPRGVVALHARNGFQILGQSPTDTKSSFVVCWTADGSGSGGTGQAIRIAKAHGVPVFDLAFPEHLDRIARYCGDSSKPCS